MIVIAFGHKTGVGKDTAARFLQMNLKMLKNGVNIRVDSMARPVKDIAALMFGGYDLKDANHYEDYPHQKDIKLLSGRTPREYWNMLTDFGHATESDVWVNMLFEKHRNTEILILRDLRYSQYIDHLKNYATKLYLVKINRSQPSRSPNPHDLYMEAFSGWTHKIDNDGSMKELNVKVLELAKEILNVR